MEKTRAIVLHSIKYGESQFIVDFLTESRGRVSFLVKIPKSSKSNSKRQYFQPLTLVTLEFDFRANQNLQRISTLMRIFLFLLLKYLFLCFWQSSCCMLPN